MAYTKSQQWKEEESERLSGERDQIKLIDLRYERWQVVILDVKDGCFLDVSSEKAITFRTFGTLGIVR